MTYDERKEQSMPVTTLRPITSDEPPADVRGTIIFHESEEFLVCDYYLRNFEKTFIRRQTKMQLEVAENIFKAIQLIHPGTTIKGLKQWIDVRINYLYLDEFDVEGVLRNIFLTKFCELNQIELDL